MCKLSKKLFLRYYRNYKIFPLFIKNISIFVDVFMQLLILACMWQNSN